LQQSKIIVIAGPTASGKTTLSIAVAKELSAEILSFDSRQFFREIPIGTAAPTLDEMDGVPHHFVGNKSISQNYSAGMFAEEARNWIREYFSKNDNLVVVGGSGMYLSALLYGFDDIPPISTEVRASVQNDLNENGMTWLQSEVQRFDPAWFATSDTQNQRRLSRVLEVVRETGKPLSFFQSKNQEVLTIPVVKYGIMWDPRELLYQRINQRVDAMMELGLLDEVKRASAYRTHQALQTVGYRELFEYLDGKCSLEDAVEKIKQNTRRYAKRQYTWFRNQEKDLQWLSPGVVPKI
jgi:tRNA dimethylallyltransferase